MAFLLTLALLVLLVPHRRDHKERVLGCSTTLNGKTEYWGNSNGAACPEVRLCSRRNAWGNLLQKTVTKCSAENLSVTALTNNQLSGYSYDAAGNMTHDATTNLNYSFDQENRITGAAGYTYTYDADGNRVEKSNGSTGTIYWYMSPGIVAESDLTGSLKSEYVFFDGERVARRDLPGGSLAYYFLRPFEDGVGNHQRSRRHHGRRRLLSLGR